MAKYVIKDAILKVNSVDLSVRVAEVRVFMDADDVDVSTMGTGVHQHLAGLRNDRFEVVFLQDFSATAGANVDATLYPLVSTATTTLEFPVSAQPFSGSTGATNPLYASTACILLTYQPLNGAVGARSEADVTFPSNAQITRNGS